MKCDKCKETIVEVEKTVLGIKMKYFKPCKCQREKAEQDKIKFDLLKKQEILNKRKEICFGSSKYKNATWQTDNLRNSTYSEELKRFTPENEKLKTGLLLFGGFGTGKTFYASCIANNWIEKGKSAFFTTIAEVAQADFEEKRILMNYIERSDLVVFDDLGSERDTEYMNEQVYNMINSRYITGKTTIFTTNVDIKSILYPKTIESKRIYSRVLEMTFPYEVVGQDQRREIVRKNHEMGKKILKTV